MLLYGRVFLAILLIFSVAVSLPLSSKGLLCKCTNDTVNCQNKSGTCETMPGGACFAQNHSDISGRHWTMRKGCLDDPSSPICQLNNENGARISGCCNDTDMCNVNLLQIDGFKNGMLCKCTNDTANCQSATGMCETKPGGVCYAQYYSDLSGQYWNLRKGCVDDPSSPICQSTKSESDGYTNLCCNDTNMCNENLIQIDSLTVDVTCNCVNTGKCDNSECILKSAESWCYTIIRNFAGAITYQRGCTRKCKEYHNHYEMRTCCQGNKCNNETIPYTWPSVSSTVSTITPTKTSQYVPPSLIEGTPPPLVQPTTNSPDILTSEKPVTVDPQHPRQLTCYCSGCTDGSTTCLATVACASLIIESINMTWCIHDYFSCKNDSFLLNCCYKDYCNGPPQPSSGPPCDDEDMEQSGGCEFGTDDCMMGGA